MVAQVTVSARFHVPPAVLYNAFLDERDVARMTRSPVKITPTQGGEFSFFNGSVVGSFAHLEPNLKIVQKWRFSNWDSDSDVTMDFVPISNGDSCELRIKQTSIPDRDKFGNTDQDRLCSNGWEQIWIRGLESILGFPKDK